jgi:cytochrome c-type biogenesis protein CcmH/NrfF
VILLAASIAVLAWLRSPPLALGQSLNHSATERDGLINITSEAERLAFGSLTCCCGGCPHEVLLTCPCGYADGYREDIRAMITRGMSLEQIKAEWVKRYGPEALTVPPNSGANRFLYLVPLVIIVAAAAFVILTLRHFRRREEERDRAAAVAGGAPLPAAAHDEYDDKLDDELRQLDQEE